MCTSYHVFCVTCQQPCDLDRDGSRGEELMRTLIEHRATVEGLSALLNDAGGELDGLTSYSYGHVDAHWFARHVGHELKVRNEYGVLDGECAEYWKCQCSAQHRCKKPIGHDGEHGSIALHS